MNRIIDGRFVEFDPGPASALSGSRDCQPRRTAPPWHKRLSCWFYGHSRDSYVCTFCGKVRGR